MASHDKAIALKPDSAEAFNNRGNALQELKRLDEALASYDKAIAFKPDYAEAQFALCMAKLPILYENEPEITMRRTAYERLPSFDLTNLEERYNKRLAIIVPYRDRYEHLRSFLPHITTYFQRDKLDRQIRYKIYVIEQYGIAPFNKGMLANSAFVLAREENDYFCIHDVDYLPIWADYSWGSAPARLIWHGLVLKENWNDFFGGVVLFDKRAFEAVNGFPNCYWGWGPEDLELGQRFRLSGLDFDRRDGTFMPLPHKHAGFSAPGVWTEEARRTAEVYKKRKDRLLEVMKKDGLNNLSYKVVDKLPLKVNEIVLPESFHYVIDISDQPPSG